MYSTQFQSGINGNFVDISTDIYIDDVIPEEGLCKLLDMAFNIVYKAKQKRNSFKFQIICQAEFKVNI